MIPRADRLIAASAKRVGRLSAGVGFRATDLVARAKIRRHRGLVEPDETELSYDLGDSGLITRVVTFAAGGLAPEIYPPTGLRVVEEDPPVAVVDGARVLPAAMFARQAQVVYDGAGATVPESVLHRGLEGHPPSTRRPEPGVLVRRCAHDGPWQQIAGPAIYVGNLFAGHFGHFLTEATSRLWYVLERPDLPIIHHGGSARPRFVLDLLDGLGVSMDRVMDLPSPAVVDELHVPAPSFVLQSHVHRVQRRVGDAYARGIGLRPGGVGADATPLYLSRSRLDSGRRRLAGEADIERALRGVGARVIHPQEIPLVEQAAALATHDPVIGPRGSAFFTALLTPDTHTRHIYLAARSVHPNLALMNALMGIDPTVVRCTQVSKSRVLGEYERVDPALPTWIADQMGPRASVAVST